MDKNYYIPWGVHLPFRFYTDRAYTSAASDYGRAIVIPKTEFLIFPYGEILPFQVVRFSPLQNSLSPTLTAYCLNGSEEDAVVIPVESGDFEYEETYVGMHIQRLVFVGRTEGIDLPMGSYYFKFTDGTGNNTWYSENVNVLDIDSDTIFRKWSNSNIDLRTVDNTDLRIV